MRNLKISAIEVHAVRGARPPAPAGDTQRQVNALNLYAEHRAPALRPATPSPAGAEATSLYLRIGTDGGAEGFYGPIDPEVPWSLLRQLGGFLIGQDALATTIIWDKLERLDRHARHGHLKMAISAIDNALWDLKGRVLDAPVWQLLGGASRERIPAYASLLGTSLEPDVVARVAAQTADEGFAGQKWFLAYGPGEGEAGMKRNVELAEQVREAVGAQTELMYDVFQGWDLGYARSWAQQVAPTRPAWLEEPFSPNRYPAFVELHRSTGIPLSAGEHLYDRAEVLPYLQDGVLAAVQSDPEWCGGVTELVRICALAETFGVPVIPHGHGLHAALHVVASQSPVACPKVEYLVRSMPNRHHFEASPPTPEGGSFALPTGPGFGIRLDESKIDSRELLQFG
ncbi:MAG: Mandelate racemase/muconate lactonizing enzyme C-terminal domain protein [Microbacteriaceae bacterium]|jgi:L-rhamnonate dehydratase|nr:Mandelate racemase/muconate lactonizing enzyme C-terminal domain protein [Microbacteriaceae bacterium]